MEGVALGQYLIRQEWKVWYGNKIKFFFMKCIDMSTYSYIKLFSSFPNFIKKFNYFVNIILRSEHLILFIILQLSKRDSKLLCLK
jgi:hypothetical protein